MKYVWLGVFIICLFTLGGCESNAETSTLQSNEEQWKAQIDLLTANNQKMQERLNELENTIKATDEKDDLLKTNPQLAPFTAIQNWEEISLSSGDNKVTITDPVLLEQVSPLFVLAANKVDLPNGPPNDIDTFTVELTNDKGSNQLEAHSRNYGSLPDLSNEIVRISADVANLGKAFLPRPSYVPDESLESRLLNSGVLLISTKENQQLYFFSESRVRSTAKVFLTGEKKQVTESSVDTSNLLDDMTFLLHGGQIQMKVYSNYVVINDNNKNNYWYKIDTELSAQLHAQLSSS